MFPDYIIKTKTLTGEKQVYKLAYTYETIAGTMGRYVNENDSRNYTILTLKQAIPMTHVKAVIVPCKVNVNHMCYNRMHSEHHNYSYVIGGIYAKVCINGY